MRQNTRPAAVIVRHAAALAQLRQHRILGEAPTADLEHMLSMSQIVVIRERGVLFRQGDAGRAVAIVLSGFVKLSTRAAGGREVVLEICGSGSLFGELAILNGWPRSADAVALTRSEIVSVPGSVFRATLDRSPGVMVALIGVLSRRLHLATEQIRDAASLCGPVRLAKALGMLAQTHGSAVGLGLQIDIALSQRELGCMSGLSRESINKQLAAWRDRGWVEVTARHITLTAPEALRRLVDAANTG